MTSRLPKCRRLALLLYLWCWPAVAQITIDTVPGGVVEIPLGAVSEPVPQAFFGQRHILVMPAGPRWVGLVGLPRDLVPGRYVVRTGLDDANAPTIYEFMVLPRHSGGPPLAGQETLPPAADPGRLEWRQTLEASLPLRPPLASAAKPLFGRHHHEPGGASRYLDFVVFEAAVDSQVMAAGNGRVDSLESYDSGVFVWIDHGMGLYTRTGPLSRTALNPDDPVEAGQSIGRIILDTADQPRALYWSVFLNGTAVNPFLLSNLSRASLPARQPDPTDQ